MNNYKKYTGKKFDQEKVPSYFPSKDLIQAVEYARLLQRPLLIRGEPGSGKTRLAQAVAYELYGEDYQFKYFEWFVKSTSKAEDGLYSFDHLSRLRDVQMKKDLEPIEYLELGPLGKAIENSTSEAQSILLIDEIDKADIDFPNDLLLELDQKRFYIPEVKKEIIAKAPPIIFITSNDEKELPNAFLRRCIFFYVELPKEEALIKIINAHLKVYASNGNRTMSEDEIKKLVIRFNELHIEMNKSQSDKTPSTSELIDWARLIQHYIENNQFKLEDLESGKLPYAEVLLKTLDDYKKYYLNNAN